MEPGTALCRRCRAGLPPAPEALPRPGPLAGCLAAAAFEGRVADAIHRYKYPPAGLASLDPAPAALLRALIVEAAEGAPGPAPELLVPVPLHPRRLRQRGFNPACELARALPQAALDAGALRRLRDTPSQTGLGRAARRRNVRGAFAARPGWRAPASVWLVDDVVTTGSTLAEAARALRRAGARHLVTLCAAATPRPAARAATGSRSARPAAGPGPPAS